MPQVEQIHHRSNRPIIALALGGAVVLVIVVAGIWWLLQSKPVKKDTNVVLNEAADKVLTGKRAEAIELLNQQLKQAKTDEEKVSLYMSLGVAHQNNKDLKAALEAYKKADAIKQSFGTNMAIASVSEALGDKATALEYYQRNYRTLKDGKEKYRSAELPSIEEAIKRLGGKL